MWEDPLSWVRRWHHQNDAIKGVLVQIDEMTHLEEGVTEQSRSGPGSVGPGRSTHPISTSVRPPPFLECEDASALSHCGHRHSEKIEPYIWEVVHKRERLEGEEIIRERDASSPRRRPQAEEDIEAVPRRPQSWRKTPSKESPWSMTTCLVPLHYKKSFDPWRNSHDVFWFRHRSHYIHDKQLDFVIDWQCWIWSPIWSPNNMTLCQFCHWSHCIDDNRKISS
jgi:hypothetical protein